MSVVFRVLLALLCLASAAAAQSNYQYTPEDSRPSDRISTDLPPPAGLPSGHPLYDDPGARVTQALNDARDFCGRLPDRAYRIDCLAERMGRIASAMPSSGPYAESRRAIQTAADKLAAIAKKYEDPSKPGNRYGVAGPRPQKTTRPLTPVNRAAAVRANAEARAVLEEAETVLLRSSATQVAQAGQIRSIAAAVDSNKVLLRSA